MNGVTQLSSHTFEIGGMGAAGPQDPPIQMVAVATAPPNVQVAPLADPARATDLSKPESPLTARQLLTQLRSRLRDVKRELKAKGALEKERDQLQRLIRAATTELDNVRRLRAAG